MNDMHSPIHTTGKMVPEGKIDGNECKSEKIGWKTILMQWFLRHRHEEKWGKASRVGA